MWERGVKTDPTNEESESFLLPSTVHQNCIIVFRSSKIFTESSLCGEYEWETLIFMVELLLNEHQS